MEHGGGAHCTPLLVLTVQAVLVAIADPSSVQAPPVAALKLIRLAQRVVALLGGEGQPGVAVAYIIKDRQNRRYKRDLRP